MSDLQDAIDWWKTNRVEPFDLSHDGQHAMTLIVEAARKWEALQHLVESGEAGRIIIRAGRAGAPTHWPAWRNDLLLALGIIDELEIGYAGITEDE